MSRIISSLTVVLGAATAALANLPYSWAHITAVSLGAAIASMHVTNAVTSTSATTADSSNKDAVS